VPASQVWLVPVKNRRVQYEREEVIANHIKEFKCIKPRGECNDFSGEDATVLGTSVASVRSVGWKA
jgi:hypothetical protein